MDSRTNQKVLSRFYRIALELLSILMAAVVRTDRGGVSKEAGRVLRTTLGDRYGLLVQKRRRWIKGLILVAVIIGPATLTIILQWREFVQWCVLKGEGVVGYFSSLLLVPLALVGLVIPFLTLATTLIYSKLGLSAGGYVMRALELRRLIVGSLIVLVLDVTVLTLHQLGFVPMSEAVRSDVIRWAGPTLVGTLGVWTVGLVVYAGAVVTRIVRSFDPRRTVTTLSSDLVVEGTASLRKEMEYNIAQSRTEQILDGTKVQMSFLRPDRGLLVVADRVGVVGNISVLGLRYITWMLSRIGNTQIHIDIVRLWHRITDSNKQIATIRGVTDPFEQRIITRLLKASIRVEERKEREDTLYDIFKSYGNVIRRMIRDDQDELLGVCLDGYGRFLLLYLDLQIPLKAESYPGWWFDWRPITLMMSDLGDSAAAASDHGRRRSAGTIGHWLKQMLDACVEHEDEYIFSRLLQPFGSMYNRALETGNTVALHRPHFEPLNVFDYLLFEFGQTQDVGSELVEQRVKLGHLIVKHLENLLRLAMNANDREQVAEMLRLLKPSELFANYRPDLIHDKYDYIYKLEHEQLSDSEKEAAKDRVRCAELLEEFRSTYDGRFRNTIYGALSYQLERIKLEEVAQDRVEPVTTLLWSTRGSWQESLDWMSEYTVGSRYDRRDWEIWPESRTVQSKDPMSTVFLVTVLSLLDAQVSQEEPLDIPGARSIDSFLDQLKDIAQEAAGDQKWSFANTGLGNVTVDLLCSALDNSSERYKEEVAREVRESHIDTELVSTFESDLLSTWNQGSKLKQLFHRVPLTGEKTEIRKEWKLAIPRPKEAFLRQDRIHYGRWGKHWGEELARDSDAALFEQIPFQRLLLVTERGGFASTLDEAINHIERQARGNLVILMTPGSEMRSDLWRSREFTSRAQLEDDSDGMIFGAYRGIPIYVIAGTRVKSALVCDASSISYMEEIVPGVVVDEYGEDDIKKLCDENPDLTPDRIKEHVRVKIEATVNLAIEKPHRIVSIRLSSEKETS